MLNNPLFPTEDDDTDKRGVDPFAQSVKRHGGSVKPLHKNITPIEDPAVNMIRQKIQSLYAEEPNARKELEEAKHETHPSKHQRYMEQLSTSGMSLADIQVAWHKYYADLSEQEKHEVWQEFYDANSPQARQRAAQAQAVQAAAQPQAEPTPSETGVVVSRHESRYEPHRSYTRRKLAEHPKVAALKQHVADHPAVANVRSQVNKRVSAETRRKAKHHFQSLLFGVAVGTIVILITLFSFFNDRIIAPFIQPSRSVSATPLILAAGGVAPTSTPQVIIPKINVEIPLDFSVGTTDENQIENALQDGVVHYPTTVLPGQIGNTAFFGHSSNNIFNPGKYKFAFALLHDLVPGDTFYLTYGDKVYAYQVYDKQIVDPGNVSVLNNVPDKTATATLITCDPPGTSLHRLVVWGEQVSPNPGANSTGSNTSSDLSTSGAQLPSNGPSLWNRLVKNVKHWF